MGDEWYLCLNVKTSLSLVEVEFEKNLIVSHYLKSRCFCHLQRVVVHRIELDLQEKGFFIYQENTVKWNLIIYRIYCNKIKKNCKYGT